jgi:hypothetical protein
MIPLIVSSSLILTACNCKPKIEYVKVPYEVKVPVKCKVPDTYCDFNQSTSTEVISSLLICIVDLKRNQEVCK